MHEDKQSQCALSLPLVEIVLGYFLILATTSNELFKFKASEVNTTESNEY